MPMITVFFIKLGRAYRQLWKYPDIMLVSSFWVFTGMASLLQTIQSMSSHYTLSGPVEVIYNQIFPNYNSVVLKILLATALSLLKIMGGFLIGIRSIFGLVAGSLCIWTFLILYSQAKNVYPATIVRNQSTHIRNILVSSLGFCSKKILAKSPCSESLLRSKLISHRPLTSEETI